MEKAFKKAFDEIETLGMKHDYKRGLLQFRSFMDAFKIACEYDISYEKGEEAELDFMRLELIIERSGKILNTFLIGESPSKQIIKNAKPGTYTIKLNTGRVLWEDRLTEKDLLWVYAFPEEGLPLAADTGDRNPIRTREVKILDGELILRVYPGLEAGRLDLEIRGTDHG
jgi:hypothetical protein